jgi:hypothetical protein
MDLECNVCRTSCTHQICFVLKPCNHVTCIKCFHQAVPSSYAMQCPCPGCQRWVETSTLCHIDDSVKTKEHDSPPERDKEPDFLTPLFPLQEVSHFEPDEQMDPFRHWAKMKPDIYSGFLYVAFRYDNEEASFYKANFKAANSTVVMDDNSSDDLVKIFARVLHPLLFRKNFVYDEGTDLPLEQSMSKHSRPTMCNHQHQQLALTSLFALSSGRVMTPAELAEITGGSLLCQRTIKQKAIQCAKSMAKNLLQSKRKNERVSIPTNYRQHRKSLKRHKVLSPIQEDHARDTVATRIFDNNQPKARRNLSSNLPEAQVPYMFGILLFAAAWIFSN